MTKPSTEDLKNTLEELVNKHNQAIQVQNQCREQIIAVQAVIQDRDDGDTDSGDSSTSED